METIKDVSEVYRRASLISLRKEEDRRATLENKIGIQPISPEPKDTFNFIYALFLFIGLLQMLPVSFFITANDYWMYKFRDTSQPTYDSLNRNTLQTIFTSWSMMVSSVPMLVLTILSTFYGHRMRTQARLLSSLLVVAVSFVLFTAFIKINTDTWQTGFFVLTMIGLVLINGMMSLFGTGSMAMLSKFPRSYMKPFLLGQGMSGLFSAILQIISLAIGGDSETSALIYFSVGTGLIWLTLFLIFISKSSAFYQHHMGNDVEDMKRPAYKVSEILACAKRIWPLLAMTCCGMFTLLPTHPAVTSLVVSENYGNGSAWSDKYFVPVITFLFGETCSLCGRASVMFTMTRSTGIFWITMMFLRMIVLLPLILLCNAQPRNHLQVVFDKDWEYILILGVMLYTHGFFTNLTFLSVPKLADGEVELALLTMLIVTSAFGVINSPLGLAAVNII